MATGREPGSFRDPSGFLFWRGDTLYRQVDRSYADAYDRMMSSGFYDAATERGLLVEHEELSEPPHEAGAYVVLRPTPIRFVSFPYEWCFGQLQDAALLTLRLQTLALEFDLSLKDASAFNVQFDRGRPVFIDTLSFEPYREGEPWVAYEQYCRHFLAPLALMAHAHVDCGKLMRVSIDGIPLDLASRLLPARTLLSPGLLVHLHWHARMQAAHADDGRGSARRDRGRSLSRSGFAGILDALTSTTRGLAWKPDETEWADYYEETNYSDRALAHKTATVERYLDRTAPDRVWDLGANTGRFSRLASDRGIDTIAFDVDPAAVERNYRRVRENRESSLLPLLQDLTNPSPALGWNGEERASLAGRGPVDMVFALALIHHLCISHNVPIEMAARFFARLCRHLVIEFVPKEDSQVERLLATRPDIFPRYTRDGFEAAFGECFEIEDAMPVEDSDRVLYLMRRRSDGLDATPLIR